jgi:hypothetical protein
LKRPRKKASELIHEVSLLFRARFFTSDEGHKMREHAIKQLDMAIEELWRERKKMSMVAQSRVYTAIGYLARARDEILTNTEVSDILQSIEEARERAKKAEEGRREVGAAAYVHTSSWKGEQKDSGE